MIFINLNYNEWIKRYPKLEFVSRNCTSCQRLLKADRPFITKDYAGLYMDNCPCGKNQLLGGSMVAISKDERKKWQTHFNLIYEVISNE